jgi:hypothetical protein
VIREKEINRESNKRERVIREKERERGRKRETRKSEGQKGE